MDLHSFFAVPDRAFFSMRIRVQRFFKCGSDSSFKNFVKKTTLQYDEFSVIEKTKKNCSKAKKLRKTQLLPISFHFFRSYFFNFPLLDLHLNIECRSRSRRENECGSMWIGSESMWIGLGPTALPINVIFSSFDFSNSEYIQYIRYGKWAELVLFRGENMIPKGGGREYIFNVNKTSSCGYR